MALQRLEVIEEEMRQLRQLNDDLIEQVQRANQLNKKRMNSSAVYEQNVIPEPSVFLTDHITLEERMLYNYPS